jgi:exodeoxyribonuclease-5
MRAAAKPRQDVLRLAALRNAQEHPRQAASRTMADATPAEWEIQMITTSTIVLSDEQERAMAAIDEFMADPTRQVFHLHGLAGSGKTTVLRHVAQQYKHATLCTLTGKAASVLRRKTGLAAQTLHSFFYHLIDAKKNKRTGREDLRFARSHEPGQLSGELVLIDETSMISEAIWRDLLATGAKIIACGDPGQLPPVQGVRVFDRADFMLTEIHRQALDSPIIRQAHAVRRGKQYEADGPNFRVVVDGDDDNDLLNADAVLVWTNKSRDFLNARCRRIRGFWQSQPQPGEILVCLKNCAPYGLFNGATYTLLEPFLANDTHMVLDVDGDRVTVPRVTFRGIPSRLDSDEIITASFDYGYALTVHKSQGSEWSSVVLVDEYRLHEHRREWLYTGITRAADRILIVR